MKNRGKFLDETEEKYVHEVVRLEKQKLPFTHQEMCRVMGWRSVASSWNMQEKLIKLGVLKQSQRLAFVTGPVVTPLGKKHIGNRKAA